MRVLIRHFVSQSVRVLIVVDMLKATSSSLCTGDAVMCARPVHFVSRSEPVATQYQPRYNASASRFGLTPTNTLQHTRYRTMKYTSSDPVGRAQVFCSCRQVSALVNWQRVAAGGMRDST